MIFVCAPGSPFSVHRGNDNAVRQDGSHHARTLTPLQRPEKFHFSSGGVNMVKHSPSKMGARERALWKPRSPHCARSLMAPCVLLKLLHTDLLKEGCKTRFLWHFHQTVVARRPRISFLFSFFYPGSIWWGLRRSHTSSTSACPPSLLLSFYLAPSLCLVVTQQKTPNHEVL